MYLYGEFLNKLGQTVRVDILTDGDKTEAVEIGADDSAVVWFTDDPVTVDMNVNDTFDVLLPRSATINLYTSKWIPELFTQTACTSIVNIRVDGVMRFAGFIEPQTYSQDFVSLMDGLEINCIDALSALQYENYMGVGSSAKTYAEALVDADERTFLAIIQDLFSNVFASLDLTGEDTPCIYYDGTKRASNYKYDGETIFDHYSINDLLFLGEEEDDVWTKQDTLESMLKFLNLHIIQDGLDFYIFDWRTVRGGGSVDWEDIISHTATTTTAESVTLTNSIAADVDSKISIGETFNRLELTCDVQKIDNLIESPLDSDALTDPFSAKQLYMTEYSSDGEGESAINAFWNMTHDKSTDFGDAKETDWYIRMKDNPNWRFYCNGQNVSENYADGTNQHVVPNMLRRNLGAALIAWGKNEKEAAKEDNSPVNKLDMETCLVMSVNGNNSTKETGTAGSGIAYPSIVGDYKNYPDESDVLNAIPYAEYIGKVSGGVFSPSDNQTTNYLVISGKICLNPLVTRTASYLECNAATSYSRIATRGAEEYGPFKTDWKIDGNLWHLTVPSKNNDDGRYLAQRWYKASEPRVEAKWDKTVGDGLAPFTDTVPATQEFNYSAIGEASDTISKVAAICCMLVIGDKCVVEMADGAKPRNYVWHHFKERSECADDAEYYAQSFTIGFDPKIKDKLVGTEFEIQNNIDYTLGIDADGTAIPIGREDKISGKVRFWILGPVNLMWNVITRRHPSFWRHTSWSENSVPIMPGVANIIIKSFDIKVYSDNAMSDADADSDLVYISDTDETFANVKDDLEFKIHSALTSKEAAALGVSTVVAMSTPKSDNGLGVTDIYDVPTNTTDKAEKYYVDAYYNEYHTPRITLKLSVDKSKLSDACRPWLRLWTHPALEGKTFSTIAVGENLMSCEQSITMKEIPE